ncbi:thioredoxin [Thermococcus sp. EP1]|uniref:thioredoxin family protein n=1 Tax=Thermococcus sp. EP1 TaxID=1591054 RepID=UPI0006DB4C2A|nr:thioredoxin family protein [Thermococcus sp. EP1]KPU62772.1 thioredoxin [Thermococcus sp. EP1]
MIKEFDGDFEVIKRAKHALLWFSSPGCPPCKMIEPFMHELSERYKEVEFWEVDIEKYPRVAQTFEILNVPTLVYLKKGGEVDRQNLVRRKEEVEERLKKLLKV